jgi:hypothetical protein
VQVGQFCGQELLQPLHAWQVLPGSAFISFINAQQETFSSPAADHHNEAGAQIDGCNRDCLRR